MCNVIVYDGNTETVIQGDQITGLKMPFEFGFDWFQSSGVLELSMPTAFSPKAGDGISISTNSEISNSKPMCDVRVNGFTYTQDTFDLIDFQQCSASIHSQTLVVTPSIPSYSAGNGLDLYFGTFSNSRPGHDINIGGTLYSPTQITEMSY